MNPLQSLISGYKDVSKPHTPASNPSLVTQTDSLIVWPSTQSEAAFLVTEAKKIHLVGQVSQAVRSQNLLKVANIFFTLSPTNNKIDELRLCLRSFFRQVNTLPRRQTVTYLALHPIEGLNYIEQAKITIQECQAFLNYAENVKHYSICICYAGLGGSFNPSLYQNEIDKLLPLIKDRFTLRYEYAFNIDFPYGLIDIRSQNGFHALFFEADRAVGMNKSAAQVSIPPQGSVEGGQKQLFMMMLKAISNENLSGKYMLDATAKAEMKRIVQINALSREHIQRVLDLIDSHIEKNNLDVKCLFPISGYLLTITAKSA